MTGSTDNSQKIIKEYQIDYPTKIIYLEKENGGLSDARNYALPYAKGEYIGFVDSDDYVEITMFEKMYQTAKQENADMVECDFVWVYPNRRRIDHGQIYQGQKEALQKARVVAWNKLIKREIIQNTGIQFPKGLRYEDVAFFYQLLPYLRKIAFVKEPLVYYIQRKNSISNSQNSKTSDIFSVFELVFEFYRTHDFYESFYQELEYTYTRYLLCSSLLRVCKIQDKKLRKQLIKKTWNELNEKFPDWKKNLYLQEKGSKNHYMRNVNRYTYPIYATFFHWM